MKTISLLTTVVSYILISCLHPISDDSINHELINETGTIIKERFNPPPNFERHSSASNSFESYLQNLPFKEYGSQVKHYNGQEKSSDGVYCAVVDLEIGKRDLHQCADAVMRLRAETFI